MLGSQRLCQMLNGKQNLQPWCVGYNRLLPSFTVCFMVDSLNYYSPRGLRIFLVLTRRAFRRCRKCGVVASQCHCFLDSAADKGQRLHCNTACAQLSVNRIYICTYIQDRHQKNITGKLGENANVNLIANKFEKYSTQLKSSHTQFILSKESISCGLNAWGTTTGRVMGGMSNTCMAMERSAVRLTWERAPVSRANHQ